MNHADAMRTLFPNLSVDARQKMALNATTLKTAYRRQMLRFHPDRQANARAAAHAHEKACTVQAALEVLQDYLSNRAENAAQDPLRPRNVERRLEPSKPMKFGDFLVLEGILTRENLNQALREQHHRRPSFGATAVTLGYLGPNELSRWLEHQAKYPGRLGDILIRERRLTRLEVDAIIAEQQRHSEPLGTLLTKLGMITSQAIETAYRRYQTIESTESRAA